MARRSGTMAHNRSKSMPRVTAANKNFMGNLRDEKKSARRPSVAASEVGSVGVPQTYEDFLAQAEKTAPKKGVAGSTAKQWGVTSPAYMREKEQEEKKRRMSMVAVKKEQFSHVGSRIAKAWQSGQGPPPSSARGQKPPPITPRSASSQSARGSMTPAGLKSPRSPGGFSNIPTGRGAVPKPAVSRSVGNTPALSRGQSPSSLSLDSSASNSRSNSTRLPSKSLLTPRTSSVAPSPPKTPTAFAMTGKGSKANAAAGADSNANRLRSKSMESNQAKEQLQVIDIEDADPMPEDDLELEQEPEVQLMLPKSKSMPLSVTVPTTPSNRLVTPVPSSPMKPTTVAPMRSISAPQSQLPRKKSEEEEILELESQELQQQASVALASLNEESVGLDEAKTPAINPQGRTMAEIKARLAKRTMSRGEVLLAKHAEHDDWLTNEKPESDSVLADDDANKPLVAPVKHIVTPMMGGSHKTPAAKAATPTAKASTPTAKAASPTAKAAPITAVEPVDPLHNTKVAREILRRAAQIVVVMQRLSRATLAFTPAANGGALGRKTSLPQSLTDTNQSLGGAQINMKLPPSHALALSQLRKWNDPTIDDDLESELEANGGVLSRDQQLHLARAMLHKIALVVLVMQKVARLVKELPSKQHAQIFIEIFSSEVDKIRKAKYQLRKYAVCVKMLNRVVRHLGSSTGAKAPISPRSLSSGSSGFPSHSSSKANSPFAHRQISNESIPASPLPSSLLSTSPHVPTNKVRASSPFKLPEGKHLQALIDSLRAPENAVQPNSSFSAKKAKLNQARLVFYRTAQVVVVSQKIAQMTGLEQAIPLIDHMLNIREAVKRVIVVVRFFMRFADYTLQMDGKAPVRTPLALPSAPPALLKSISSSSSSSSVSSPVAAPAPSNDTTVAPDKTEGPARRLSGRGAVDAAQTRFEIIMARKQSMMQKRKSLLQEKGQFWGVGTDHVPSLSATSSPEAPHSAAAPTAVPFVRSQSVPSKDKNSDAPSLPPPLTVESSTAPPPIVTPPPALSTSASFTSLHSVASSTPLRRMSPSPSMPVLSPSQRLALQRRESRHSSRTTTPPNERKDIATGDKAPMEDDEESKMGDGDEMDAALLKELSDRISDNMKRLEALAPGAKAEQEAIYREFAAMKNQLRVRKTMFKLMEKIKRLEYLSHSQQIMHQVDLKEKEALFTEQIRNVTESWMQKLNEQQRQFHDELRKRDQALEDLRNQFNQ